MSNNVKYSPSTSCTTTLCWKLTALLLKTDILCLSLSSWRLNNLCKFDRGEEDRPFPIQRQGKISKKEKEKELEGQMELSDWTGE